MNDKSVILKAFNNQLGEFSDDLLRVFPDNNDIRVNKQMLETIRKTNPRLVIDVWHKFITLKYSKEIENNDYSFFINKDYSNDIQTDKSTNEKYLKIIETLRNEVKNLPDEDKSKAMKYLQNLIKLSTLYYTN